jgi:hypothetical protein
MSGGLYNAVLGDGNEMSRAALILPVFEQPAHVGRFRDIWVENHDGEPVIAIYTRNGGPNREDQAEAIESMRSNPLYLRDADDEFDSTYATFYFRAPERYRDMLAGIMQEPVDMSAKWREAIEAVKTMSKADFKALRARVAQHTTVLQIDPETGETTEVEGGLDGIL